MEKEEMPEMPAEKKKKKFNKFFSSVSHLEVADSTPIETQIELVRALKEVE